MKGEQLDTKQNKPCEEPCETTAPDVLPSASNSTEYECNMEAKLAKLGAQMDALAADLKEKYSQQLDDLQVKRAEASEKLTQLKNTSGAAWHEFKLGMDNAWFDLNRGWDEVTKAWEELKQGSDRAAETFRKTG